MAAEAERASIKYKQVEFMSLQDRRTVFNGIVTGVTDFGIFVEITSTSCEGMVRLADLNDDFYEWDKANGEINRVKRIQMTKGGRTKRKITVSNCQSATRP